MAPAGQAGVEAGQGTLSTDALSDVFSAGYRREDKSKARKCCQDWRVAINQAVSAVIISNINIEPGIERLPDTFPSFSKLVLSGRFTWQQEQLLCKALPELMQHVKHLDLTDLHHTSFYEPSLCRQLLSRCRFLDTATAIPLPELPLLVASLKHTSSITSLHVAATYTCVATSPSYSAQDNGWGDSSLSSAWRACSTNNALHQRRHGCLRFITQLHSLSSLTLDPELVIRQDQLSLLTGLLHLSHLSINLGPACGSLHIAPDLSLLQKLEPLRHLELCTAVSGAALQQLAQLSQVQGMDLAIRSMQVSVSTPADKLMQQLSLLANLRHLSFTNESIKESYDAYSSQQQQQDQAQGCALRVPELLEQLAVPSALMVPQPSLLQANPLLQLTSLLLGPDEEGSSCDWLLEEQTWRLLAQLPLLQRLQVPSLNACPDDVTLHKVSRLSTQLCDRLGSRLERCLPLLQDLELTGELAALLQGNVQQAMWRVVWAAGARLARLMLQDMECLTDSTSAMLVACAGLKELCVKRCCGIGALALLQVLRSMTQLQRLELHCDGQLFDFGSYRHEERWALPLERLRLAAAGRAAEGLQVVLHYGDLVDLVM